MPSNRAEWNPQCGAFVFERGGRLWRLSDGWQAEGGTFARAYMRIDGAACCGVV